MRQILHSVEDDADAVYEFVMRNGWGDGLPIIPPTRERVAELVSAAGRAEQEVVATLAPEWGEATVEAIASNAVMAGCAAHHMPVVIAAVAAMASEEFNLYGVQSTTNPVAVAGFVNGPIAKEADFNSSWNCLGPGNRSNAVVGRALRLILMNIGGGVPGDMDRATHGQPGKFSFFFAENEEDSPWSPYHKDQGYDMDESTVTVFGPASTMNFAEATGSAEELLRVVAAGMRFPCSNDSYFNGQPWLVFAPEHAEVLSDGGYAKADVQQALWETSQQPFRVFTRAVGDYWVRPTWEPYFGELRPDTMIPITRDPADIRLVVAGGPSIHTVFMPTFGDCRSVTAPVSTQPSA